MNYWLLLLSIYPYICLAIFLMGIVWRYDKSFYQETSNKYTIILQNFLRITFMVVLLLPIAYPIFSYENNFLNYFNSLKAIATFNFDYAFLVNAPSFIKIHVFILSSLLMILAFTSSTHIGFWKTNSPLKIKV